MFRRLPMTLLPRPLVLAALASLLLLTTGPAAAAAPSAEGARSVQGALAEVRPAALHAAADETWQQAFEATGAFIVEKGIPSPGEVGGEWAVIGLARAGYPVPAQFYPAYLNNVVGAVVQAGGVLSVHNYTEYSRVILGLTAIGADVTNVGGYNLLEKLADYENAVATGINGPVFALIALDSHDYQVPQAESVHTLTTRELLIEKILDMEIVGGGWAFTGSTPDVDMTAMTVQSLAPYYDSDPEVAAAVDRALIFLSSEQQPNGGYASWGTANSESVAQVILTLTALNIDPLTDSRFIKNGNTTLDALMGFYVAGGGFKHIPSGERDDQATEQGYYALAAYHRFTLGQTSFYDMTEVSITLAPAQVFSDVPPSHLYSMPITALAQRGVVTGYAVPGGGVEYRPGNPILRAQVAKMLVIAFGLHDEEVTDGDSPLFGDVPLSLGVPYPFDFVQEGAKAGLIQGYADGTFGPYVNVTRIQLLRMLVRGAGDLLTTPPDGYETPFTDVSPADRETVAMGRYNGVIDGKTETIFDPSGSATRGQFAKMLYSVLPD